MASWVTHLMIADSLLEELHTLDRRGFCVGSIAPDCNIENADFTAFTPTREVTHFMRGRRKCASDCERFANEYLVKQNPNTASGEQLSFLLGYYAHLIADAELQAMLRSESRAWAAWSRITADKQLGIRTVCMEASWDSIKQLVSKAERMQVIHELEAEYLSTHPRSGYLEEILPLREFPDYLDFLPGSYIVRKIGVMSYIPQRATTSVGFLAISREEYIEYIESTCALVKKRIADLSHNMI